MEEQNARYNEAELALIRETFKDNLALLKAIRKSFLQLSMTEKEEIALRTTIKGEVLELIKKSFLPEITGDEPLNQVVDLMMTIDVVNKTPQEAKAHLDSRHLLIAYMKQQLAELEGNRVQESEMIHFLPLSESNENPHVEFANLVARNTIILLVENQIRDLNSLANREELTDEEKKEAAKLDSTK